MKGHFITFEGGDGAGKSTLIKNIYDTLTKQGHHVVKTHAPGATPIGEGIRELLLHSTQPLVKRCELFLYLADRAQHVETIILPALEEGNVVLCDRYNDSTIAYQGYARGLDMQKVEDLCHFTTNGLDPDLTLYLDLDPKIGLERIKIAGESKDRIEAENLAFHEKIRKAFHDIAKNHPQRFHLIDASQPKQTVFEYAMRLIDVHCFARNA